MKEKGLTSIIKNYCGWTEKTSEYIPPDNYHRFYKTLEAYYKTANDIIKDSEYTKEDIQEFCKLISGDEKRITGLYLSSLINKITKEDEKIILQPNIILDCLGYKHAKGILTIEGDAGDFTGTMMTNGTLIVEGDAGHHTCPGMTGGKLKVKGRIASLASDIRSGEVWQKDRLVFTDRTFSKNILRKLGFKV